MYEWVVVGRVCNVITKEFPRFTERHIVSHDWEAKMQIELCSPVDIKPGKSEIRILSLCALPTERVSERRKM